MAGGLYSKSDQHFVALWANASYAGLMNNSSEITPRFGIAPALGIGYQLRYNTFLLQSGMEGNFAYYTNHINTKSLEVPMIDTQGKSFTMQASVLKELDECKTFQLQIPFLLGYEYRYFYFLAGAKAGFNLWSNTSSYSEIKTSGDYQRYIGIFEQMPNHQFTTYEVTSEPYEVQFRFNVMAHAEIGLRLDNLYDSDDVRRGRKIKPQLYLSFFADYGLLNVHNSNAKGSVINYVETPDKGLQFYVTPALVSDQMTDCRINPLYVGIKFTMLMEVKAKPACVICSADLKK